MDLQGLKLIVPGTWWQHRNGNMYLVLGIANMHDTDRYPVTVMYRGENGMYWTRRADDWHRSLTLAPEYRQKTVLSQEAEDLTLNTAFRLAYFEIAEAVQELKQVPQLANGGKISVPGATINIF